MELRFPTWADTVYKHGGVIPFGYVLHGSGTEGPATVERARYCDEDNGTDGGRMLLLRGDDYERWRHHRKLEEEKRP